MQSEQALVLAILASDLSLFLSLSNKETFLGTREVHHPSYLPPLLHGGKQDPGNGVFTSHLCF